MTRRAAAGFLIVTALAGIYYYWGVRATGNRFYWRNDLPGYYNYLGRAFAAGHTYLPVDPSPELLALPDPWDGSRNWQLRLHDAVLFNKRYYLYHGAGPAVLFFTPWRLLTGYDLPENFALFAICLLAFLFAAGTLIRLLALAGARPGAGLLTLMLLALAFCQCVPYLLSRIWVYEIAIATGYFAMAAGFFFLVRSIDSPAMARWLIASGLFFGIAIACRPHLGFAGMFVFAVLIWQSRMRLKPLAAFAIPFGLCGLAVLVYNYVRFGNPLEFGVRYLLASAPNQQRVALSVQNIVPGLYYFIVGKPEFSPVFPWFRLALRFPFDIPNYPFPPGYFIEPIAGILWITPLVLAIALLPIVWRGLHRTVRAVLAVMILSAIAIMLFVLATGFTTQRYVLDFLPLLLLASLAIFGVFVSRVGRPARIALVGLFAVAIVYSMTVNLALGITGPYDEIATQRPQSYVRIARWFSPTDAVRPLLNPHFVADLEVGFKKQNRGFAEPLLYVGGQGFRYELNVEHTANGLRLLSTAGEMLTADIPEPNAPVRIRVEYQPQSETMTVTADGRQLIQHQHVSLIAAPEQVLIGRTMPNPGMTTRKFSGSIRVIETRVGPG